MPSRLLALLLVSALLAGCTSDGGLGAIDERAQADQAEQRARTLWRAPAGSHRLALDVEADAFAISGDTGAIALRTVSIEPAPVTPIGPSFGPGPRGPAFEPPRVERLAIEGVVLDGVRGWLVLTTDRVTIDALEGDVRIERASVQTRAAGLAALLGAAIPTEPIPPFPCFGDPSPHEPEACADWRASRPLRAPEGLAGVSGAYTGLVLPPRIMVDAARATFYDAQGNATAREGPFTMGAGNARLHAVVSGFGPSLLGPALLVPLPPGQRLSWDGNITLDARAVAAGHARFADNDRALAGVQELHVALRGNGIHAFTNDAGRWRIGPIEADTTSLRTDGIERLGASLRLLPDQIAASGPAGNLTRVKLILAESSGGADAQLTGYRLDTPIQTRFIGAEPFAITNEIFELMRTTDAGFVTPAVLLGLGLTVPFVALAEAFVGIFQAFFPPNLAGPLPAGQGQILTFEMLMPNATSDIEILIEAANADPARAKIRLTPSG